MIISSKYLIVSYTHRLNGKPTNLGGPAQHLARYLGDAHCIWQPIPIGKPQWVYFLLKIRDIFKVLLEHKPAEVYIGVESVNALLGKLLGYPKVIYWNLDYSPKRGFIWSFLDRFAIKLSDEVWTLSERGFKTVPIGYWSIDLPDTYRDPLGIVYIGLLQDMQGVEGLIWEGIIHSDYHITIIGTGKDEMKYREMAKDFPNIKFTGLISDEEATRIMLNNTYGWAMYHPLNPTHKTTPCTKIVTYISHGLQVWGSKENFPDKIYEWSEIFKNALNSHTDNP